MSFERLACFVACFAVTGFAASTCDSLTSLKLLATTVTAAHSVEPGAFTPPTGSAAPYKSLPAFCRVQGVIAPSPDSHIEFEVWLPVSGWNGSYLGAGNGGFAGSISYPALAGPCARATRLVDRHRPHRQLPSTANGRSDTSRKSSTLATAPFTRPRRSPKPSSRRFMERTPAIPISTAVPTADARR